MRNYRVTALAIVFSSSCLFVLVACDLSRSWRYLHTFPQPLRLVAASLVPGDDSGRRRSPCARDRPHGIYPDASPPCSAAGAGEEQSGRMSTSSPRAYIVTTETRGRDPAIGIAEPPSPCRKRTPLSLSSPLAATAKCLPAMCTRARKSWRWKPLEWHLPCLSMHVPAPVVAVSRFPVISARSQGQ